jgi:hypothetical protein
MFMLTVFDAMPQGINPLNGAAKVRRFKNSTISKVAIFRDSRSNNNKEPL